MISNPKHGWCNFKLGNFEGTPSYLTDVPVDVLQAFIDLHSKGSGCVFFDEEGTEFTLVLNPYGMYIIDEKETPVLHDFSKMEVENIENELIKDLESDMCGWAEFITYDGNEEIQAHREDILDKIVTLKKISRFL